MRDPASLREVLPLCERPGLPLRDQASLWEALPPCERPRLPVKARFPERDLASLWGSWPSCENSGLLVRGPASLWGAHPPCDMLSSALELGSPKQGAFLWGAWSPCERLGLPVRGTENRNICHKMPFCHKNQSRWFDVAKKFLRILLRPHFIEKLHSKVVRQVMLACYTMHNNYSIMSTGRYKRYTTYF